MKKIYMAMIVGMFLTACTHTPNFCGTYAGILPAADAPGIETILSFEGNGIFRRRQFYLERDMDPIATQGTYRIENNILILSDTDFDSYYAIEENSIRQLDFDRDVIEGPIGEYYILRQISKCR